MPMPRTWPALLLMALLLSAWSAGRIAAADWPQFRGPGGQGHSSEKGLPLAWSETADGQTRNITWKVPVAGLGWSSPAIQGKQIWLTTALDDGRSLRAVALDRDTGSILHDVEVFEKAEPGTIHNKNSHASPTPVVQGSRVYVHYGAHGMACLSTKGKVLWRNTELVYDHRHGPAGSPVLYKDLLIVNCDGTDVQFVAALDQKSGATRWKMERPGQMAYSTPLVIRVGGKDLLISTSGEQVVAYNPSNGEVAWKVRHDGYSLVPRPVFGHGLVYVCTGYDTPLLYAIRPDGAGDVTETHIEWTIRRNVPHNPSPLLVGDELYFISDNGIATCADARSGQERWQQRIGGNYAASPIFADGRIYFLSEEGLTTVIAPSREFKKLASNQVQGRTLASLAVSDGAIFLRTATHLYRIEEP